MRTVIIGSGVIGLACAWALRRKGHEVTVIDREVGPGLKTSHANGALLTASMADPWNSPGCWKVLLRSLGQSDAALQLRLKALPSLGSWGLRFLWNSRPAAFEANRRANLRLAVDSLAAMDVLRAEVPFDYSRRASGSLRIFRDEASLAAADVAARWLNAEGLEYTILSNDQAVALEPALGPIADDLAGAILYEGDEVGDASAFCRRLTSALRESGVEFLFETEVQRLEVTRGRCTGVVTSTRSIEADAVIVACASDTPKLLREAGLRLPVKPVKGYSITVEASKVSLERPVIDDALHAVAVPLGSKIRAAGTAEFAGFDRTIPAERIGNLIRLVEAVLPELKFDPDDVAPWCGLRVMSTDGVPIIGESRIPGLWINTGHGHLGWTMAAGSARLIADGMANRPPSNMTAAYAPSRFGC